MTELNQEALEKAKQATGYTGHDAYIAEDIIRTYLASLPPVDAGNLVERLWAFNLDTSDDYDIAREAATAIVGWKAARDAWKKMALEAEDRQEAAEAEVARLKAERDELLGEVKRLAISEAVETRSAEEHEAENERLKAELAEAHRVIEPFAAYFEGQEQKLASRGGFAAAMPGHKKLHSIPVDCWRAARSFRDGQKTGEKG